FLRRDYIVLTYLLHKFVAYRIGLVTVAEFNKELICRAVRQIQELLGQCNRSYDIIVKLVIPGKNPRYIDFFLVKYILLFVDQAGARLRHEDCSEICLTAYRDGQAVAQLVFHYNFIRKLKSGIGTVKYIFIDGIYRNIGRIYTSQVGN